MKFFLLFLTSLLFSGCLHTRGTASSHGYIQKKEGVDVKSSEFFISAKNFSVRCGRSDVYIIKEGYSNDRAYIEALALRSDNKLIYFAPENRKDDISEG